VAVWATIFFETHRGLFSRGLASDLVRRSVREVPQTPILYAHFGDHIALKFLDYSFFEYARLAYGGLWIRRPYQ